MNEKEEIGWEHRLTKVELYVKINLLLSSLLASYIFGVRPMVAALSGVILP